MNFFQLLFGPGNIQPHGYSGLWSAGLPRLNAVSDSLIAISYFIAALTLLWFVRRRRDLPFSSIFSLVGAAIVACGAAHAMAVWNLRHADYSVAIVLKAIAAATSAVTAIWLMRLVPTVLALPSINQWASANVKLENEYPRTARARARPTHPRSQLSRAGRITRSHSRCDSRKNPGRKNHLLESRCRKTLRLAAKGSPWQVDARPAANRIPLAARRDRSPSDRARNVGGRTRPYPPRWFQSRRLQPLGSADRRRWQACLSPREQSRCHRAQARRGQVSQSPRSSTGRHGDRQRRGPDSTW